MSDARLWTRNFILVSAINFFLVMVFYLLVIVIVGYAVTELQASTADAGLISGLFIVGTLVGRLVVGQVLLRFGRKTTMLIGLSGFFILSLLYFLPIGVSGLLVIRFIHGFMMGLASTVLGTIIAQILPPTRRGEGIGYFSMSSTLGTAIGPFVAIWMMLHLGYNAIFALSSGFALMCLLIGLCLAVPDAIVTSKTAAHRLDEPNDFISKIMEKKAIPIGVVILLVSSCYSGVLSYINFYAKEINLVETASVFFLMYAVAILISRPFTGPLMDRKGENIIMYPAFILMALGLFTLSQVETATGLLLSAALLGLGYGNIQSVCQTIAIKSTDLARMGFATSTFFIFLDAGLGFGPYFLGLALNHIGYSQLYLYSAIASLAAIGLYYVLHARHLKPKPNG